jgi:hypothetical protein
MLKREILEIVRDLNGAKSVSDALKINNEENKLIGNLIYEHLIYCVKNPNRYVSELLRDMVESHLDELQNTFTKKELQKLLFAIQIAIKYVFKVDVKKKEYEQFKKEPISEEGNNEIN